MLELTTISEKSLHPTDGMTWIQYCFPNITRPGTGHEKARTSCNVKNRELPRYARHATLAKHDFAVFQLGRRIDISGESHGKVRKRIRRLVGCK
jgi:hypothetical protein